MNSAHETDRKWEIWDEKMAEQFTCGEATPPDLLLDLSLAENHRHGRLVKKVYSMIEGESVLDVGCGVGYLFPFVKGRLKYLGVDTSKSMLSKAKEFFPLDKEKFQFGDAYDLSMLPRFDTVVAIGVILHLPDSDHVIQQLWSKAQICVVFSTWIGMTCKLVTTNRGPGKKLIQRRETIRHLSKIFHKLENLDSVEKCHFSNPVSGESNYIFKLWERA